MEGAVLVEMRWLPKGCSMLSTAEGTVTKPACRRGQGHLAGAEGWRFGSRLSAATLDRCISLEGVGNQRGSAVSPGRQLSYQSHRFCYGCYLPS